MSPSFCPISNSTSSRGPSLGERGEHVAYGSSTACLPYDCSAKDADARTDSGPVCITAAKVAMAADCSMLNTGASGTLIIISAVETTALPPVAVPVDNDREDQAAMLFLGANLKGPRLWPALQGAQG